MWIWAEYQILMYFDFFPLFGNNIFVPLPIAFRVRTRGTLPGVFLGRFRDVVVSCFLFLFLLSDYFFIPVSEDKSFAWRLMRHVVNRVVSLPVSISGVCAIYLLTNYVIAKCRVRPASWVINVGAICFGVYIYQQFILQVLYYKTSLPQLVGPYWLPWIACVITFIFSRKFCLFIFASSCGLCIPFINISIFGKSNRS